MHEEVRATECLKYTVPIGFVERVQRGYVYVYVSDMLTRASIETQPYILF